MPRACPVSVRREPFAETFAAGRTDVTYDRHRRSMQGSWRRLLLVAFLGIGWSCAAIGPEGAMEAADPIAPQLEREPERPARDGEGLLTPVVLVTVDGARWQEIFVGTDPARTPAGARPPHEIVPNLDRLVRERGAALGAPGRSTIAATGPNYVSLPGYTELLTGRAPRDCQDNDCRGATLPTFLDQAHDSGATVAAFASWEKLERAVSGRHDPATRRGAFVTSCGRGGDPAVDPWPGHGDYRPDRLTRELALAHLERARPDVLFVGLGDTDELAHRGDYEGYLGALAEADAFVGRLFETLDRMGSRGARTHVFVTADHGRAEDFANHGGFAQESARVWLIASGPSVLARGRVDAPRAHHLADVVPTMRKLLGMPLDRDPSAGLAIDELFAPGS